MRNKKLRLLSQPLCFVLMNLVLLGMPSLAQAVHFTFGPSSGSYFGNFSTSGNWYNFDTSSYSGVPAATDDVSFQLTRALTANFTSSPTTFDLQIFNGSTITTLQLNGFTYTLDDDIIVGGTSTNPGVSELRVFGGALNTTNVSTHGVFIVGNNVGSSKVTLSGPTASSTNAVSVRVGNSGEGTLEVLDGATFNTDASHAITAGFLNGSAGSSIKVDGTGSILSSGNALNIGFVDDASLMVTDGGSVSNTLGRIGYGSGATGTVTIKDAGSTWSNSSSLYVGGYFNPGTAGVGVLNIENEGVVTSTVAHVGRTLGSEGTVTIKNAGSSWQNTSNVLIGNEGKGTVHVQDAGALSNDRGFIGFKTGGDGTVNVTGTGSTWTNSDDLYIGGVFSDVGGTGVLNIEDEGVVTNLFGFVGRSTGSEGTVTIKNAGSSWQNTNNVLIGYEGKGTVHVQDAGALSNDRGFIGFKTGGDGTVNVTGTGSTWTNSDDLYIGGVFSDVGGTGVLNIEDEGVVTNAYGFVGYSTDSEGTVTIKNAGSSWQNTNNVLIGYRSKGTVHIQDAGALSNAHGYIGFTAGGDGTVNVTGTDSTWTNNYTLNVGGWFETGGTGVLNVEDEGVVTSANGFVGRTLDSEGTVTIKNAGSSWQITDDVTVGHEGKGTLHVQDAGVLSNEHGFIGSTADGDGTVNVTGTDSTWTNVGNLYVGGMSTVAAGTGELSIENSGAVSAANVTVWTDATVNLINGKGTLTTTLLTIKNGGEVFTDAGAAPVLIDGGIVVESGGLLSLGGDNGGAFTTTVSGNVEIQTGGTVDYGDDPMVGSVSGEGSLNGGAVGTGPAKIGGNDQSTTFSGDISGARGFRKEGTGTWTLSGISSYTGPTFVDEGELVVDGDISSSSSVTVAGGAKLSGGGLVGVLDLSGGALAPGNSTGMLSAGDTTWGLDGMYEIEINDFSGTAGSTSFGWDVLDISGGLTITSTPSNPFVFDLVSLNSSQLPGMAGNYEPVTNYSLPIAFTTTGITGLDPDSLIIDVSGIDNILYGTFSLVQSGNDLLLQFTHNPVPEPSTFTLAALGFLFMLKRRQRRA